MYTCIGDRGVCMRVCAFVNTLQTGHFYETTPSTGNIHGIVNGPHFPYVFSQVSEGA